LEGRAAELLIRTVVYPVIDTGAVSLVYTLNVETVQPLIAAVRIDTSSAKAAVRNAGMGRAIAAFVVGNDFAEYLGLDE
jgi:hypothetical protein